MVSAVLLAAGLSSRFGSSKALATIKDTTIIELLQNTLISSKVHEVVVVLGACSDQIQSHILKHKKVRVVYNKDYNLGQTSSFKTGVANLSEDCEGILLLPVDYPAVKKETINLLIDLFKEKKPMILIPSHDNRKGHPPIFDKSLKKEILLLDNDSGVNTLSHQHEERTLFVSVDDPGVIYSFNTSMEFEQLKACLKN